MQFGTRRIWVWVARILIAALMVSGVACSGLGSSPGAISATPTGTCDTVQSFASLGQFHIQPGEPHSPYNSNPPTSGWHWDSPQREGIFTTQQVQEQILHNLEHGFVNIQYKDLNGPEVQRLTDLVRRDQHHVILAPYPGLPAEVKVAMTAWTGPNGDPVRQVGKLQYCKGVDENAIRAFISAYRDKGPELIP